MKLCSDDDVELLRCGVVYMLSCEVVVMLRC